ncbi:hypothetical protein OUZ56_006372 [Daphnia magna]|uniref:Uncharacterized protein n=1 Tax=Daphnia magna TaxID=35525 RepID=A0ABQ9YVG3_9CRUS|nr:hypothetical protein OUZ56_006372 [Daphnia magna]
MLHVTKCRQWLNLSPAAILFDIDVKVEENFTRNVTTLFSWIHFKPKRAHTQHPQSIGKYACIECFDRMEREIVEKKRKVNNVHSDKYIRKQQRMNT